MNLVCVKILSRIEPKPYTLLTVAYPCRVHIGLQDIGLARFIAEKLEIKLVMLSAQRRRLERLIV